MTRTIRRRAGMCVLWAGCAALVWVSPVQWLAQTAPGTPAATQNEPALSERPPEATFKITAREILLDIAVTDASGHPVTGLSASDFTVTEQGAPQKIRSLEEHRAMTPEEIARTNATPALPANTFSNYAPAANTNASTVILLDALDTRPQAQMYLRQELIDYLKHMKPGTPIAIFQMDMEMRLIQGFTPDPAVLLAAAESKRDFISLNQPIYGSQDYNLINRNALLHAGLTEMGRYLAGFPGRKSLIWFTGQIPIAWWGGDYAALSMERSGGNPFRDDLTVVGDDLTALTDALTLSRVAVFPIDARGLQTPPQFDASNSRRPAPSGFMRSEQRLAADHMALDSVAKATGGRAYFNTNGLKEAIAEIVESGSNYYALSYATDNTKWEGQYRRIKVTVDRPGVKLEHREGYYAINREDQEKRQAERIARRQAAAARRGQTAPDTAVAASGPATGGVATIPRPRGGFDAAMQLGAIPPTEIVFQAKLVEATQITKLDKDQPLPKDNYLAADYKGKPFRTYMVEIETDPRGIRMDKGADGLRHGNVQFVTLIYDQTGARVNSLQSTVSFDVDDEHYTRLLNSKVPCKMEIAVPEKGNFFLRVGVHDVTSDRVGALEIPVDQVRPEVALIGAGRQ